MIEGLLPWLPGFAAAYLIQAVGVASPGPGVALLLGLGLSQGRAAALAASLGIAVGASVLAFATTQGLGLLLEQVAWLSTVVRVAGACYLAWLAIKSWQRALKPSALSTTKVPGSRDFLRSFGMGLAIQLTNPKAIVFWLAIATVGATKGAPAAVIGLFVLGAFLVSLAGHGIYATLLSSLPFQLAYGRARRWIETGVGGCLMWFAFVLATDRN